MPHGVDLLQCLERVRSAQNTEESTSCTLSTKIEPDTRGTGPAMTTSVKRPDHDLYPSFARPECAADPHQPVVGYPDPSDAGHARGDRAGRSRLRADRRRSDRERAVRAGSRSA